MMWMITSFPLTYGPGFPVSTNLIADGTLNQSSPVAIPVAISVVPTPVEKAPSAPYVQVWESAPMIHSPATTIPYSGKIACSTPHFPCTRYHFSPCSFAKSWMDLELIADLISLFGVKWSGTSTTLSLSNTLSAICRKIGRAIGPVISFAITTSSFASINWPAVTESSPAWAARIFCVIVIPIVFSSFIAQQSVIYHFTVVIQLIKLYSIIHIFRIQGKKKRLHQPLFFQFTRFICET